MRAESDDAGEECGDDANGDADKGQWRLRRDVPVRLLPLNFLSRPLSFFSPFISGIGIQERRELGIFGEGSSVGSVDVIIGDRMHG